MGSFAKYVGGSPTNTAIGLARLGLKSAVVTRVGADHMGRFIAEQLEREGVDTSSVRSDPDRLTALVILGIRDREQFPLIFYRENCADMALGLTGRYRCKKWIALVCRESSSNWDRNWFQRRSGLQREFRPRGNGNRGTGNEPERIGLRDLINRAG